MRGALPVVAAALVLALQAPGVAADFPKYTGYLNDYVDLLPPELRGALEEELRAAAADTTAEIAVAIVPSLDGMSVEEYANRLFQEWGVGKAKVDNGILVVVAPTEREMRIEVGYGLEPVLPDGLAGEIIRTNFLPHFREDRYDAGVAEGMRRIIAVVRANHVLTAEERAALDEADGSDEPLWLLVPFFGLFVSIGAFMAGVGTGSKTGFPLLFGTFFGGVPFLMSLLASATASALILGPLAVGLFTYGYRLGRRKPAWVREMRQSNGGSRGGWVMGASSSSSSRSSSSSGSSFGGGSSGGGGASGRW